MLAEIFMLSVEADAQSAREDPAVHLDRDRVLIEDNALWRLGHGFTPRPPPPMQPEFAGGEWPFWARISAIQILL